eukprot:s4944_g4.t1
MEALLRSGSSSEAALNNLQASGPFMAIRLGCFDGKSFDILAIHHHLQHLPMEALENAASFAAAYQVGRLEAGAAVNLLTGVTEKTRAELKDLVRRGLLQFPISRAGSFSSVSFESQQHWMC